jgi:CHAT domain-containing protein
MDPKKRLEQLLNAGDAEERRAILDRQRPHITRPTLEQWKEIAQARAYAGDEAYALRVAETIVFVGQQWEDTAIRALGQWTWGNVCTIASRGNEARTHYRAAAALYRAAGDRLNLARMNVGVIFQLYHTGEYERARQIAAETEPILAASDDLQDRKRLASVANNLAIIFDRLGRYEQALERYEQKIALWETLPDDPQAPAEIARTRINVGVTKKRLNLWAEAQLALEAGRQTLSQPAWQERHPLDLVRAELHLADLLARSGAPADAVQAAFARARHARAALSPAPQDLPDLSHLDLYEAEWQLQSGRLSSDLPKRLTALRDRTAETGQARESMLAELLLAHHRGRQGDLDAAIRGCTAVRQRAQTRGDWELVYRAWHALGQVHVAARAPQSAREAWQSAVAVIERTGQRVASGDLRSGFLDDKLVTYQNLARLHLDQGDPAGALHWTERARARELVEMLADADVSPSAHPQSRRLLQQLAQARAALATVADVSQRRALEARIADLSRRGAALEPQARQWLTGETAAPEDLCAALPAETLLLVYANVQDSLWALPLTRAGMGAPQHLGRLPTAEAVERDLSWLYNLASYPPALIERRAQPLIASARRPLASWYERFLAPLSDLLHRHRRLVIAPDGPLFRLPFHALYDAASGRYLLETHQVSYTPGATAWLWAGRHATNARDGLVLAYAGERLHHTQEEVQAILEANPNFSAYTGPEATRDHLQGAAAGQAAVLHLAAHAVFRGDNPLFSHVALADGALQTLDVLRLNLNAALVVLSACETGRGLLRGGEYLGLARAFLLAGARSVLASHWAVDDAATADLMGTFYRHLAAGAPPGEALRDAQLAALVSPVPHHRHPFYWAPFFLLGVAPFGKAL